MSSPWGYSRNGDGGFAVGLMIGFIVGAGLMLAVGWTIWGLPTQLTMDGPC